MLLLLCSIIRTKYSLETDIYFPILNVIKLQWQNRLLYVYRIFLLNWNKTYINNLIEKERIEIYII